jgi:hypothetical protein
MKIIRIGANTRGWRDDFVAAVDAHNTFAALDGGRPCRRNPSRSSSCRSRARPEENNRTLTVFAIAARGVRQQNDPTITTIFGDHA